jgi:hypothetical protein
VLVGAVSVLVVLPLFGCLACVVGLVVGCCLVLRFGWRVGSTCLVSLIVEMVAQVGVSQIPGLFVNGFAAVVLWVL